MEWNEVPEEKLLSVSYPEAPFAGKTRSSPGFGESLPVQLMPDSHRSKAPSPSQVRVAPEAGSRVATAKRMIQGVFMVPGKAGTRRSLRHDSQKFFRDPAGSILQLLEQPRARESPLAHDGARR